MQLAKVYQSPAFCFCPNILKTEHFAHSVWKFFSETWPAPARWLNCMAQIRNRLLQVRFVRTKRRINSLKIDITFIFYQTTQH